MINQIRNIAFRIAVLFSMQIKHKLGKSTVKSGNRTSHQGKTGTGNLSGIIKIKFTETFTESNMILRFKIEYSRSTDNTNHYIF